MNLLQQDEFEQQLRKKLKEEKKQQQSYYIKIIQHLFRVSKPKKSFLQTQLRTNLQQMLSIPPKSRNQKHLKKIRAEMKEFKCFQVNKQMKGELQDILKKDHETIITLISPFAVLQSYKKGSIVECTGIKRNQVRIMLRGKVSLFDPTSHKSYKNCLRKIKNKEYNMDLIKSGGENLEKSLLTYSISVRNQANESKLSENKNDSIITAFLTEQDNEENEEKERAEQKEQKEENFAKEIIQVPKIQKYVKSEEMSKRQCKYLLYNCNIVTPLSPHKNSYDIVNETLMITSQQQRLFVDQKLHYRSTAVCLTDCVIIQIDYDVCLEIIELINSDKERPYIRALLFKFPMLEYFEAKKYVTQEYMLVNDDEESQEKKQKKNNEQEEENQDLEDLEIKEKTAKARAFIKELKVVSNFNCQLSYTGATYLIIQGKVTLMIDMISEKRPSLNEYVIAQKRTFPKEILQLTTNDIFGFEEIGKKKKANLRYVVEKGTKLLKLNPLMLKCHCYDVFGFEPSLRHMKNVRNEHINEIMDKMENNLKNLEIQRHENISNFKTKFASYNSLPSSPNFSPVKEAKYYGTSNFKEIEAKINDHFSAQANKVGKTKLSPEMVKEAGLGVQFSSMMMRKDQNNINILNNWVEIRNKKGKLLRKKKVKIEKNEEGNEEGPDQLLRKLGILNSKQIADHNFEIVTKRKSDYEFEDLQKEAKQFRRLRQKANSLPRLNHFFAKKEDRLFNILYKKKM